MHPDQIYELRQLRHNDLRVEAEQVRTRRELASGRATRSRSWLVTWLRCLLVRRLRGVTATQ
jgi:hypothetical protein